jgi:hypothetical protein
LLGDESEVLHRFPTRTLLSSHSFQLVFTLILSQVKIVLVGDVSVGKTCIALRYVVNNFNVETQATTLSFSARVSLSSASEFLCSTPFSLNIQSTIGASFLSKTGADATSFSLQHASLPCSFPPDKHHELNLILL